MRTTSPFKNKTGFGILILLLLAYFVFAALILVERAGIQYDAEDSRHSFIPAEYLLSEPPEREARCLLLYNSQEEYSPHENIAFVLSEMQQGYRLLDIATEELPRWENYETVVLSLYDLNAMRDHLISLLTWVEEAGGRLMLAESPWPGTTLDVIGAKLGMMHYDWMFVSQIEAEILTDFMPGGKGLTLAWSSTDTDDLRFGLNVRTDANCTVHMRSKGETPTDMLWEKRAGKGKVVVINNDAAFSKWSRGMIAAAYSLLDDAIAWPVINASMFFIDDFPAPVPYGDNPYVTRDYGMSIENFYVGVWFPDMLDIATRYDLKYTGMIIETYGDEVTPPYEPAMNTSRFSYFGNMLLNEGFEIGLHGYNHMSLVLEGFDYKGYLEYTQWKSTDDMAEGLREVLHFSEALYPDVEIKTYIPPSNVLSAEGRVMLREHFPQINAISALYVDDYFGLSQEFGVGEDGLIEIPRIAAGFALEDWDTWVILNELSLHYVNSHFIHPDDTLDPDRGADLGWESLKASYIEYLSWLQEAAPGMRSATAQEGAAAVQRFANLQVHTSVQEDMLTLTLDGFYDEAWLLVRLDVRTPQQVRGGALSHVGDNLYLLKAEDSRVEITLGE